MLSWHQVKRLEQGGRCSGVGNWERMDSTLVAIPNCYHHRLAWFKVLVFGLHMDTGDMRHGRWNHHLDLYFSFCLLPTLTGRRDERVSPRSTAQLSSAQHSPHFSYVRIAVSSIYHMVPREGTRGTEQSRAEQSRAERIENIHQGQARF
jgi:hypothetical protein